MSQMTVHDLLTKWRESNKTKSGYFDFDQDRLVIEMESGDSFTKVYARNRNTSEDQELGMLQITPDGNIIRLILDDRAPFATAHKLLQMVNA